MTKKTIETCSKHGCNLKTHKTLKWNKGRIIRLCKKHYQEFLTKGRVSNKKKYRSKQDKAAIASNQYYVNNRKEISKLNLLNKRKVMKLIDDYYADDYILEARFAIMIQDIFTLQKGSPVHEFPYLTPEIIHKLKPKFADVVDRVLMIAVECKGPWWDGDQQKQLPSQIKDYRLYLKGYEVFGVSPDNKQEKTIGLLEFLKIVCKKRKKVLGK